MRWRHACLVIFLSVLSVPSAFPQSGTPGDSALWKLMDPPRAGGSTDAMLGSIGRKVLLANRAVSLTRRTVFERVTLPLWSGLQVHNAGAIGVTWKDLKRLQEYGLKVPTVGSIDLTRDSGSSEGKERIIVLQILDELQLAEELQRLAASDDGLRDLLAESDMRIITAEASWNEAQTAEALTKSAKLDLSLSVSGAKDASLTYSSSLSGTQTISISGGTIVAYQFACFCWSSSGKLKIVRDYGQPTVCPKNYRSKAPDKLPHYEDSQAKNLTVSGAPLSNTTAEASKPTSPPSKPASSVPPEQPAESQTDRLITAYIDTMDVPALLGQVLAVGYAKVDDRSPAGRAFSNERLAELIRQYQIGTAIVYGFNLSPSAESDDAVLSSVTSLTDALQRAARDSQPPTRKIPLLIGIDQEGGIDVRIGRGVARMPSAIFFGAARNEQLAEHAAEAVAKELRALGVNMNFAPVADINVNQSEDVIGRRAFSSEKEIVSRLARAWSKGLREGGVLAIAKHYPGHGDSKIDPHYGPSTISYGSRQELLDHDVAPFADLAKQHVDGIMTSHMITPLDPERPVTISTRALAYLRNEIGFDGLVMTDDIVDMMGVLMNRRGKIVRSREDVAIDALQSGHDLVVFGCISDRESDNPERTVTEQEFAAIYDKIRAHFESDPVQLELLRKHVRRVLRAKATVCPLDASDGCPPRYDARQFRADVDRHRALALDAARASAILITENGRVVSDIADSKYFRPGKGPLSRGQAVGDEDNVLIVSPVHYAPDELFAAATKEWITGDRIHVERILYGFSYDERKWAASVWKQEAPVYSRILKKSGRVSYDDDVIDKTVARIVQAGERARVVVVGVMNQEQIKMLDKVCDALRDKPKQIFVLLFKEPYFVPSSIYEQDNVSVLYLSALPSPALAVELLFGRTAPKPAYELSVFLKGVVDHPRGMGTPPSAVASEVQH